MRHPESAHEFDTSAIPADMNTATTRGGPVHWTTVAHQLLTNLRPDHTKEQPMPDQPPTNETRGGPWTRHGHAINGITVVGTGRPPITRCGGPALCGKCREDEARIRAEANR